MVMVLFYILIAVIIAGIHTYDKMTLNYPHTLIVPMSISYFDIIL